MLLLSPGANNVQRQSIHLQHSRIPKDIASRSSLFVLALLRCAWPNDYGSISTVHRQSALGFTWLILLAIFGPCPAPPNPTRCPPRASRGKSGKPAPPPVETAAGTPHAGGFAEARKPSTPPWAPHPARAAPAGAASAHGRRDAQPLPRRAPRQACRALRPRPRAAAEPADARHAPARLRRSAAVHAAPPAAPGEVRGRPPLQDRLRVRAQGRPADRHRRAGRAASRRTSAARCCSASPARARPSPWPR